MKDGLTGVPAGWRKIVSDLLIFSLFFLLADRLFFFGLRSLEARLSAYYARTGVFSKAERNRDYPILLLGTSRTFEGVHSLYLTKGLAKTVYKEAYAGKGPRYNYLFYREFKKHFPPPKLIIYGIDYFIYSLESNRLLIARLGVDLKQNEHLAKPLLLLSNKARFDDLLDRGLLFVEEKYFRGGSMGHGRDQAFMNRYVVISSLQSLMEDKPPRFVRAPFRKFPGREGVYLERLLEELQRDQVRVCLLILPDHIGTLKTNFNQRKFKKDVQRWARDFRNVFICDFCAPESFPLSKSEYFLNGGYGRANSHLSKAGASRLNALLIKELQKRMGDW